MGDIFKGMEKLRMQYLENIMKETQDLKNNIMLQNYKEEQIRTFFHQIYGSGSSYGFDFVTYAGKALSDEWHDTGNANKIVPILEKLEEDLKKNIIKLSKQ